MNPTRRNCVTGLVVATVAPLLRMTVAAATEGKMQVENTSLSELQQALIDGKTNSTALTQAYIARIAAYDAAGPQLNSVRQVNPDALAIAGLRDKDKPSKEHPLAGIPILVKDNCATGDRQHTTAGSLALDGASAREDSTVVSRLRAAGAVILGKANLTEFANILAIGMPSGYSSLGGQVKNPYVPELDDKLVPIVPPGGSSAGSAVAVAAGLCAAAIGTETSGSLLNPATQNMLVTVKPTVGLISRVGIIPIAHSQDTAGPLTRTVRDAAILLNVLAAHDAHDPTTQHLQRPSDYTAFLDKDGLKGTRIGLPSDPEDPANDFAYGKLTPRSKQVMQQVVTALKDCGAEIVVASIPTIGWMGGPGTTMPVLNRNPESKTLYDPGNPSLVFLYELKHDLNLYLHDWATNTSIHTLADVIAFNAAHADKALRFGQDLFLAAETTKGDLSELEYRAARAVDIRASRAEGLDWYMDQHKLDAVLFPGSSGAAIAAKAGYPSVQVPAGFTAGLNGKDTPDFPIGATFTGRAWSEATLLRIAYAFEQASQLRRAPQGYPALD
jgi:amidase